MLGLRLFLHLNERAHHAEVWRICNSRPLLLQALSLLSLSLHLSFRSLRSSNRLGARLLQKHTFLRLALLELRSIKVRRALRGRRPRRLDLSGFGNSWRFVCLRVFPLLRPVQKPVVFVQVKLARVVLVLQLLYHLLDGLLTVCLARFQVVLAG